MRGWFLGAGSGRRLASMAGVQWLATLGASHVAMLEAATAEKWWTWRCDGENVWGRMGNGMEQK